MHCREILFTPRCSPRAREFPRSVNLLYDVRLRSYEASNFYNFRTCRWPAYSPGVILQNHSIFPRGSRKSKGVPSGTGDFLRLLVGDLATPKLVQIFVYGKWLYPYIMVLHGALDLDRKCLKTHNSEDKCTFPPNIFTPTAKITRNPHFGGTFNAKPIIQSVAR